MKIIPALLGLLSTALAISLSAGPPNVVFFVPADLGETKDLAPQEPQRVAQLRAELQAWQKQVGAKFPTPDPSYDPAKPDGRISNRKRP